MASIGYVHKIATPIKGSSFLFILTSQQINPRIDNLFRHGKQIHFFHIILATISTVDKVCPSKEKET